MNESLDIHKVEETSIDEESVEMEAKARDVAHILSKFYPDHVWIVGWMPGAALCVKNLSIPGNYGYTIATDRIATASELTHTAMLAGGELLERCGMKRGRWDGQFAKHIDGAAPQHQPPAF